MQLKYDAFTKAIYQKDSFGNDSIFTPIYYCLGLHSLTIRGWKSNALKFECYDSNECLDIYSAKLKEMVANESI